VPAQAITSAPASLQATHPDAARCAQNEDPLALGHLSVGRHHAQCRAVGHGEGGSIREGHAVGNADQLVCAGSAQLGEPAMHRLAHQAAFDPIDRIDEHTIALLPVGDTGTHRGDLAGHVEPHDDRHRHLDAGHAAPGEDIVVVERACFDRQDDVAFARLWIGKVGLEREALGSAMGADDSSFHVSYLLRAVSGRPAAVCRSCWCRRAVSRQ
jgi:hypothetical protein